MKSKNDKSASAGMGLLCSCRDKYTIEPHGKGYALYYGRCIHKHGFNLCLLSEFDSQGKQTRQLIERALNKYFGT